MKTNLFLFPLTTAWLCLAAAPSPGADGLPYANGQFRGRIAYSSDGNHNDPDDWIASPVALAILAEAGLKDRLVHFNFNCILPLTNPEWEKIHAESVLGAAERYGFNRSLFFDCRTNLEAAVGDIAKAIDGSSAENPLYFIIAGPVEVPLRGLRKSDPAKRRFVYCLSHSRWNDGFASQYQFTFNKRSVIELGVNWVQIADQNRLLSHSRYGQPARPAEFQPFFWMRDARDPKVRWLWERMLVSTRPDPSDAGMMWFLATGDEECDPAKLKRLLEDRQPVHPVAARARVRIEAENFRHLEGFVLEDRKDRNASHQLGVRLGAGKNRGSIRTPFAELYASDAGRCDVVVRCQNGPGSRCRCALLVAGVPQGDAWVSAGAGGGWQSHVIRGVQIRGGDEIRVDAEGAEGRLDYVQLEFQAAREAEAGELKTKP